MSRAIPLFPLPLYSKYIESMSSESVCQVARSWVEVGSFHTRLVVRFMNFTASVRNILDSFRISYSGSIPDRKRDRRSCK
jgi:hypothetical protein